MRYHCTKIGDFKVEYPREIDADFKSGGSADENLVKLSLSEKVAH
jgi:hypothetical protein